MARRATKWILRALGLGGLLLAVFFVGVLWLANSEDALRWTVSQLESAAGGKLRLEGVRGTLLGTITAERAAFKQPDLDVLASGVRIEVDRAALRRARLRVALLRIDAIEVATRDSGKPPSPPESLLLPRPVEDVYLDSKRLAGLRTFERAIVPMDPARDDPAPKAEWLRGKLEFCADPLKDRKTLSARAKRAA